MELTLAAEAVKFALEEPEGTVTVDGTETLPLLELNFTAAPPEGAAPVKVTVQAEVPGVMMVSGEQVRDFTGTGTGTQFWTLMVPPVPVRVDPLPLGSTPMVLPTPIETDELLV
jgi:hypothetical protein